jgi:hypothetical protein
MEAVGQLTGGLAHDFNNMLTGILGGIDMVRRRLAEGRMGDVDRFLDAAMQSGQRAAALTHRLLAFSRRQTLDNRPLDVGMLAGSMADLLQRTLGEQVSLTIDMAADLWPAVADDNQLESAILNLAINARDAMPDGGQLTILGRNIHLTDRELTDSDRAEAGDYVEISVTDTGTGMPAEVLAKVFDPFYTTKPLGQGTGLGLSMIYGFVQQSRGHVVIDSQEGRGTTIRLFLPRHVGVLEEAIVASDVGAPTGTGETVLVIEDDAGVRLLVMQVLEELGYQAIETADGRQAVPILEVLTPSGPADQRRRPAWAEWTTVGRDRARATAGAADPVHDGLRQAGDRPGGVPGRRHGDHQQAVRYRPARPSHRRDPPTKVVRFKTDGPDHPNMRCRWVGGFS